MATTEQQVDIIWKLVENGVFHLAETILSDLDPRSLYNASLVSDNWQTIIREAGLWMKLIKKTVPCEGVLIGILERRGLSMADLINNNLYEELYLAIVNDITDLEYKWQNGCCHHKQLALGLSHQESVVELNRHTIIYQSMPSNDLKVFNSETRVLEKTFSGLDRPNSSTLSDDRMIICGCDDGLIFIWDRNDPDNSQPCNILIDHTSRCRLSFNTSTMVSFSENDGVLIVWDIISPRDFRIYKSVNTGTRGTKLSDALGFDDKFIVLGFCDSKIRVWDRNTCDLVRTIDCDEQPTSRIKCLRYRDGLVVAALGDRVKVWDVKSGQCVRSLMSYGVMLVSFDMRRLVVYSGADLGGSIRILNMSDVLNKDMPSYDLQCGLMLVPLWMHIHSMQFDDIQIRCSGDRALYTWDFRDSYHGHSNEIEYERYNDEHLEAEDYEMTGDEDEYEDENMDFENDDMIRYGGIFGRHPRMGQILQMIAGSANYYDHDYYDYYGGDYEADYY